MRKVISIMSVLMLLHIVSGVSAETSQNIEARMSAEQFKKSGLMKLTDEELVVLNTWLQEQTTVREAELSEDLLKKAQVANEKETFGIENRDENAVQEISSTVTGLRKTPYKKYILTLANGQIWAQKEVDTINFKVGDEVAIKRAIFGSFTLKHVRTGLATKVKRRK